MSWYFSIFSTCLVVAFMQWPEYLCIGINDWPSLPQRTTTVKPSQFLEKSSNSYVKSQINLWNARLNQTRIPSTGLKFDENIERRKVDEVNVTDDELREFSENLLGYDKNNAAKYVTVYFQGRTSSRSNRDEAPQHLMKFDSQLYKITTISKLIPLYDNYIVDSKLEEDYTAQEKQEENAFLKSILDTDVMKETQKFLEKKGITMSDFDNLLRQIWFKLYPRNRRKLSSSGFEHVFLSEIKNNQVSGLHNWLYFFKEESENRANYLGYLKKIDLGNKGAILKFSFNFHGIHKPVGSMFIGTSPEFEIALYTVCFILRHDKICPLKLNGHRFIIRTYTYTYDGKNMIGSAFPEI